MKTNYNSDSKLQSRPAQWGSKKQLQKIDLERRRQNQRLSTESVLKLIFNETPRFWELCQVVGKWVWIQFDERQSNQITAALSELGFHWNKNRQAWQHPCGQFCTGSRKDPRRYYRCYFPADMNPA